MNKSNTVEQAKKTGSFERPRELEGHDEWEKRLEQANRWATERLINAREGKTWHWSILNLANPHNPTFELSLGFGDSFLSDYFSIDELAHENDFKNRVGNLWRRFVDFQIAQSESQIQKLLRELKEDLANGH